MSKPDYDTTLARIAGNIAGTLEAERPFGSGLETDVARRAVAIARAIVAELRAAPAAAPAPAQAEGWQPIATAPKDGTRILGGNWRVVRVTWWAEDHSQGPRFAFNDDGAGPSHWMPLPVPPSAPDAETPK